MNTTDRTFTGVLWFTAGMATAFALVHAFGSAVATAPREQTARNVPPSGPSPSPRGTAARDRWTRTDHPDPALREALAELFPPALGAAADEDGRAA